MIIAAAEDDLSPTIKQKLRDLLKELRPMVERGYAQETIDKALVLVEDISAHEIGGSADTTACSANRPKLNAVTMRDDHFLVVHPNLQETQMSVREADSENDVFRVAFEDACKEDKPANAEQGLFAWDFFKYGWKAAIRCLAAPDGSSNIELSGDDAEQVRQIYETARADAAMYIEGHCADGSRHATAIMAQPLPRITKRALNADNLCERTLFEAWAPNWFGKLKRCDDYPEEYMHSQPQAGWIAWLARSALDVSSPFTAAEAAGGLSSLQRYDQWYEEGEGAVLRASDDGDILKFADVKAMLLVRPAAVVVPPIHSKILETEAIRSAALFKGMEVAAKVCDSLSGSAYAEGANVCAVTIRNLVDRMSSRAAMNTDPTGGN